MYLSVCTLHLQAQKTPPPWRGGPSGSGGPLSFLVCLPVSSKYPCIPES